MGVSGMGIGVLIGTKLGTARTTDYRMAPEGRWSRQLVLDVATTFEQHIVPTANADNVVIDAPVDAPVGAPLEIAEEIPIARRPRMEKADFTRFGYTGGCPGCVHLQAGSTGSRNHNEVCRTRIEECLDKTAEGRARKGRAIQRREDQLTRNLNDKMNLSRRMVSLMLMLQLFPPRGSWRGR